jgi:hypothetical protein
VRPSDLLGFGSGSTIADAGVDLDLTDPPARHIFENRDVVNPRELLINPVTAPLRLCRQAGPGGQERRVSGAVVRW